MKCKNCNEKDAVKYSKYTNGEFCSKKCARGFSSKAKRKEINEKVSKTLTKPLSKSICPVCGNEFEHKSWVKRIHCSNKCSAINSGSREDVKQKMRNAQLKLVKEGKHKGWKYRRFEPSYAERFFENVLNNNEIEYEREYKVGKYFIDFALRDKKMALEIDGRQHEMIGERKESDIKKDIVLKNNDWIVYRIKWNEINSENGKKKMKGKIDKFLEFYIGH